MNTLDYYITDYLEYCKFRKRLDAKSIKAYRIDLKQYNAFTCTLHDFLSKNTLDLYITNLHKLYKPKTVKRKIASLKAFFHYMDYKELLDENPFDKLDVHFREAKLLPKTIPFYSIQQFLFVLYEKKKQASSKYQLQCSIRDIAVIELLFATGMRISELCSLKLSDIDLKNKTVLIYGKGAKERMLQIENPEVISALILYQQTFKEDIDSCGYFFVNKLRRKLSDQSVRFMINHYAKLAGIEQHITPHMFRHSFATLLLEQDVDIRYMFYKYEDTKTNLEKCIQFYEQHNYWKSAGEVCSNLATEMMFQDSADKNKIKSYFENAISCFSRNDNERFAYVQNNFGIYFVVVENNVEKGLKCFRDALLVGLSNFTYMSIYLNICMCYMLLKRVESEEFDDAYAHFNFAQKKLNQRQFTSKYENVYKKILNILIDEYYGKDVVPDCENILNTMNIDVFFTPLLKDIIKRNRNQDDSSYNDNAFFYTRMNQLHCFLAEFRFWE